MQHLSYPHDTSVNNFIEPSLCTVQYSSVDVAADMIQRLGNSCLLGKADVKSAFRLLHVWPDDFDQLGFQFDNKFYFDKCLPMVQP